VEASQTVLGQVLLMIVSKVVQPHILKKILMVEEDSLQEARV